MRFVWHLEIRTGPRPDRDPAESPALLRWAVLGLAVIGVAAVIMWRLLGP